MKSSLSAFRYLFLVHVTGILFFVMFRMIFYFVNFELVAAVEDRGSLFFTAMLKGLVFDNYIASFITCLPLIVVSIIILLKKNPKKIIIPCNIFYITLYSLCFAISSADIPYFAFFNSHIGMTAFEWFSFFSETVGLVFQAEYLPYIMLILVAPIVFGIIVLRYGKNLQRKDYEPIKNSSRRYYIPLILVLWGLCFLSMRGSVQKFPLRPSYAYFSNNSFFNQLGINSTFFLLRNSDASKKFNNVNHLKSNDDAIAFVKKQFQLSDSSSSCIEREMIFEGEKKKANVVVVFMESLATTFLKQKSEPENEILMPFVNSMISKSYYLDNFYSAGIHTNNGIVSTLYGFPTMFNEPMMRTTPTLYNGLPYYLRKEGYRNEFFVTSDPQYDRMNSFLLENNYDRIHSLHDYPREKKENIYGVQDDFLFEYGLKELDKLSQNNQPFHAAFLTVSNHSPYVIPDKYKDMFSSDEERMLRFVDDCLKDFMTSASQKEWYQNTIFVLLGDHGRAVGANEYDMNLNYNHIPCIIYAPFFNDMPQVFSQLGGQIDVFPTILGLLNIPYVNNSMGIDLFREKRDYTYFVSDYQLGCINHNYFYIHNLTSRADILYNLNDNHKRDIITQEPKVAEEMRNYSVSMMICTDYLTKNNLTRHKEKNIE